MPITRPRMRSGNMSATNVGDRITKLASPMPTSVWRSSKLIEILRDRGQQRSPAPDQRPDDDHRLARELHRQRPHEGRGNHVENEEDAGQEAEGRVAAMKLRLDHILHRIKHGAVDVVQQVQRGQQRQRSFGVELFVGHGSEESNMEAQGKLTRRNGVGCFPDVIRQTDCELQILAQELALVSESC